MKIGIKRLTMLLALLSVVILTACGTPDTTLEDAREALTITYASGDSATAVTQNLPTLPATLDEVTITWASSNTAVLSNAGVVTRPATDTSVSLTATLSYDGKTDTKVFTLTVKAVDGPTAAEIEAAEAALRGLYSETLEDLSYEVTENITLVTTVSGYSVTWATADATLITTAGVVTRPAYSIDGGATVKLTATITVKGQEVEVEFFAFVKGLEKTVEQTLTEAVNLGAAFTSDVSTEGITSNQTLRTTVTYEEVAYTITWTSSHPEVMAVDGKVTRPALGNDDVLVTMTASITSEGVTVEKEVVFKVLSFKPSRVFDNIGDLYSGEGRAKDGEYVKVLGVKVLGKINDGVFLHDGTNILYVFDRSKVIYNTLEVGKVYDVEGEFDIYFSAGQLANYAPNSLTAVESTEVVADLVATDIDYEVLIDGLALPTNASELQVFYEYTRFTAKVIVDTQEGATSSYKYWLVPTDYEGTTVIKTLDGGKAIEYLTKYVSNIYYQSNDEAFAELNGKTVTIDFLMYGFRSDRYVWYGLFFDDVTDIVVAFENDAEAVLAAKAYVESSVATDIPSATTLDLISSIHGTTVTWNSSNPSVINAETGTVTPVEGERVNVTLTATITKGTEEPVIVTIDVKVGEIAVSTVEELLAAEVGSSLFRVVGTIVGHDEYRTFYFHQNGHAIAIYTTNSDFQTLLKASVGKEVEVIGTRAAFSGFNQFSPQEVRVLGTSTYVATPVGIDEATLTGVGLTAFQGKLVQLTGVTILSRSATDVFELERADGSIIKMRWYSSAALSTEQAALLASLSVGDKITYVDYLNYSSGTPQFSFTNFAQVTKIALTDEDKLAQDATELEDITLTEAGAIVLPATGTNGSTISYAFKNAEDVNNALIDLTSKTVTMPAEGQVTVVLIATVSLNAATPVAVEITVTLGAPDYLEATAAYTDTVLTTNMTGGNNAGLVGLDPLIFTVTSTERVTNPLHVGLNKAGQIRLYNDSTTLNGNVLTFAIAEGYTITGVEIVFGTTVANALITTGTTEQLNGALTASSTLSYTDLTVEMFSIKNIGTAQIYVMSVSITYVAN